MHPTDAPPPTTPLLAGLRLLVLIDQLGTRGVEAGAPPAAIDTTSRLRHLDHLACAPTSLAFVILDLVRRRPALRSRQATLKRAIRRLVPVRAAPTQIGLPQARFRLAPWQRLDDALAQLTCRRLARVQPSADPVGDLRFVLTPQGAELLKVRIYPRPKGLGPWLDRCRILATIAPSLDGLPLAQHLEQLGRRIEHFQRDEQVAVEDDTLGRMFHATFDERL